MADRKIKIAINELRIGSLVKLNDNDYHAIEDGRLMDEDNIWQIENIDVKGLVGMRNLFDNIFKHVQIGDIEGIWLNDDILRRLEVKYVGPYFVKRDRTFWYTRNNPEIPICGIHNLQNLYFFLKEWDLNMSYLLKNR